MKVYVRKRTTPEKKAQAGLDTTEAISMSKKKPDCNLCRRSCQYAEGIDGCNEMFGCTKLNELVTPFSLCKLEKQNMKACVHKRTTPEKKARGLSEDDLYCMTKHLKAYFEQNCDEKTADWGTPCIDCHHRRNCGFTQINHAMHKLSELTGIIISRRQKSSTECFYENMLALKEDIMTEATKEINEFLNRLPVAAHDTVAKP